MRKAAPFGFYGGLNLVPNKRALTSATNSIVDIDLPDELVVPLVNYQKQNLVAKVKVNDKVSRGQLLAADVVAPATGRIKAIEHHDMIHPGGLSANAIVLDVGKPGSDVKTHSTDLALADFLASPETVFDRAALAGLGGAGFPTARKLERASGVVKTLIINGAECEPEIACDEALMQSDAQTIALGINALVRLSGCANCIFAIEESKPVAIESMSQALATIDSMVSLDIIPTRYPTGAESPLIQTLTGKFIPHNEKPVDHGIVCVNVATAYALWQAIQGQALDSRVVSLGGSAMPKPCNARVRFGTSVRFVLEATGNASVIDTLRVRAGGPLSGFDLSTVDVPVTAQTNCLLAEPFANELPAQPCIRCGDCSDVCPAKLLPQQLHWFAMAQDHDKCQQLNLSACIECGCCDLVCPASIKLTEAFRYAKSQVAHIALQEQKAIEAQVRFDQREARVAKRQLAKEQAIAHRKQHLKDLKQSKAQKKR